MDEKIQKLKEIIDGSDNIVFFGGAGVSTESGVPDFIIIKCYFLMQNRMQPTKLWQN